MFKMSSFSLTKSEKAINLEKSLLDDYRKRILYSNSNAQSIQHPQYSFYYSEFCRSSDRMYNKKCLENKDEKRFDELVRSVFLNSEAFHLIIKLLGMVRESLCRDDVDVGKIIGALTIMEIYAKNLISMPWKKEFHIILTYSGMYKIWIEPHLKGIDHIFRQFGYRRTDDGNRFILVEQFPKVHLEMTAMYFRLASVLCFIIYFTQKRIPDIPLSLVFETAQKSPIGEHELISNIKEKLLIKDKSIKSESSRQQLKPDPSSDFKEIFSATSILSNKRDTGTQYDINLDELNSKTNGNINLRLKTLNLNEFIMPSQHSLTQKENKYRGARSKDLEFAFEETQSTHYGFSQPFAKGFSMCLSPEFESIVDEEEEEDESNQSPLSKLARERMKVDEESMKRMTFSTFKKQSPSDFGGGSRARDIVPSIHNHPPHSFQSKRDEETDSLRDSFHFDAISAQSKSESALENYVDAGINSRKKK